MSISGLHRRTRGSFSFLTRSLLGLWVCVFALGGPVHAAFRTTCDAAAQRASRATQVPLAILQAITRVETGRQGVDGLEPWPWAVNMSGKGHWFASADAAESFVYDAFLRGIRDFDVGCFQINYRWHGDHFPTVEAMFDPDANALYAAEFLTALFAETGNWTAAVRAYHSRTEEFADLYEARFEQVLASLDHSLEQGLTLFDAPRREVASTVTTGTPGSLFRLTQSAGRRLGFFQSAGSD